MDGQTLPGKPSQFPLKPDIDFQQYFALPAVLSPDMTDEDWEREMKRMWDASIATHKYVEGTISPDDYQDALADCGYNPYLLEDFWAEGGSYGANGNTDS